MDAQKPNAASHSSDLVEFSKPTADKPSSPSMLVANECSEQQQLLYDAPQEVKKLHQLYRKLSDNDRVYFEKIKNLQPPEQHYNERVYYKVDQSVSVENCEFIIKELYPDSGQAKPYICMNAEGEKLFMKRYFRNDDVTIRRFEEERKALLSLATNSNLDGRIPKLICSEFPHLVMDYIPGCTLQEFVRDGDGIDAGDSVKFAIKLLELLKEIHDSKIYHRDIKPSNIMLRDSNLESPVLVDFGLVWRSEEHTAITLINDNPGNRFMDLPEAFSENAWENQSAVGDITRACGILFWLLTGKLPNGFVNANGRIHEISSVIPILIETLGNNSGVLTLFDSMFQLAPNHRLQSADLCLKVINGLTHDMQDEKDNTDPVKKKLSECINAIFPCTKKKYFTVKRGWLQKDTDMGLVRIIWHFVKADTGSNQILRRKSGQGLEGKYVCVKAWNGKVYWIQYLKDIPTTFNEWLKANAIESKSDESSSKESADPRDVTDQIASMSLNDSADNEKAGSSTF